MDSVNTMPTPNYSFEKRKRDLAKKAAKEAKRLRKLNKTTTPGTDSDPDSATPDSETLEAEVPSDTAPPPASVAGSPP